MTEVQMSCGNCGESKFRISKDNEGKINIQAIIVTCTNCGDRSIIRPIKPCLDIYFGKDSQGRLCEMDWKN